MPAARLDGSKSAAADFNGLGEQMEMPIRKILITFLCVAAVSVTPAAADSIVVYNNLGPDDTYERDVALWFGFEQGEEGDPDYTFARALPFVAEGTVRLRSLEMPLGYPFSFDAGTLSVNLFEADGTRPGALLESFSRSEPHRGDTLLVFRSVLEPMLIAGHTYFVEATTTGQADGLWYMSVFPNLHLDVYRVNHGPWVQGGPIDSAGAIRVSGEPSEHEPIPEPATLVLLGTGLGIAGWCRQRHRR